MRNSSKVHDWALIVLFFGMIVLPGLNFTTSAESLDYIIQGERRDPEGLPSIPKTFADFESLPPKVEGFLNDRFGFRREMITLNYFIRHRLHFALKEKVLAGKDNWLYFNIRKSIDHYRGLDPLSPARLQGLFNECQKIATFMKEHGVIPIFLLVPEKQTVYPEHLPDWVASRRPSRYQQAVALLKNSGFDYIDMQASLKALRKWLPTYYATDSHWNEYGAFGAYNVLMNRIKMRYYPDFIYLRPEEVSFTRTRTTGMDLARMIYLVDYLEDDKCTPNYTRCKKDIRLSRNGKPVPMTPWWRGTEFLSVVTSQTRSDLRFLMLRNSYAIDMIPYLVDTFALSVFTDDYDALEQLVTTYHPDIFVWLMLERDL